MAPARSSKAIHLACCTVLAIAAASSAEPAATAAPPPAEVFAALPAVSDVVLSPNGNLLGWADTSGVEPRAVIFDLAAHQIKHQIAVGKQYKLLGLNWADDDILLVDLSQTDKNEVAGGKNYEVFRTLAVDVVTGKGNILLMTSGSRQAQLFADLVSRHTAKPKTVVMWTWDYAEGEARSEMDTRLAGHVEDSGWVSVLFNVDTRSGKGSIIDRGTQFTEDWFVDKEGRDVARIEWNPTLSQYRLLAKNGSGWREIYSRQTHEGIAMLGLSPDETGILTIGPNPAGRRVAWTIPLDGSGMKVFYESPDHDVDSIVRDPYDDAPVGVALSGPGQKVNWFDKGAQRRAESVAHAFKDRTTDVLGRSTDGKRVLARVEGPSHPPIYYLLDFNTHTADIVGDEYLALADAALGEVREISYKARDGTDIPAYLTLPPGIDSKNLPLVVFPHGGPEANDEYEFNWWAQFMATRGYAVLQPQFRGSTGHGEAFMLAGRRQWGLLMQDDVSDGVKAMIDQGIVDAKRVCIVGASYGGYAALAGAAFTPDLYKCAVSFAGVSDLPDFLGWVKARWLGGKESASYVSWTQSIGSPFDKAVIERSPAHAAANVRIPVLLIHGIDDTNVPIAQSERMAFELTKLGKPVTFVKIPGGDHGPSNADTRLRILKEVEKFLAANL